MPSLSSRAPARTTRPGGTRLTTPVIASASRARARLVVRPQRTKRERQGGNALLATLNVYRAGGLAARPGSCRTIHRPRAEPYGWSGEMMQGHAVVTAGRGPTGLVLAGERPFARGR